MQWTETTPQFRPVEGYDVAELLEMSEGPFPEALFGSIADAATAYAQTAMGRSLAQRTITATFYASIHPRDEIYLPRGPILSITSVTPKGGTALDPSTYSLEYVGNATARLSINGAYCYPKDITIVYEAGYPTGIVNGRGCAGSNIPADIIHAIKMHAAHLAQNREGDGSPPESLDRFYKQRTWEMGVG